MKKIIAVCFVLCFIVAMAVPTFAYDYGGTNLSSDISVDGVRMPLTEWYINNAFNNMVFYAKQPQGTYRLYVTPSGRFYVADNQLFCTGTFYVIQYDYTNGYWLANDNIQSATTTAIVDDMLYVDWSAQDLYTNNHTLYMEGDENFTIPPLAETIRAVAEEELTHKLLPKMGGEAMTLTICGICLMALVVGLSLFGKRSLMSLSR